MRQFVFKVRMSVMIATGEMPCRIYTKCICNIVDDKGNRSGVLLPLADFDALMEELDDLAVLAERRDEDTLPHEQVVDQLKHDVLL